jgi:dephospho-CoA kinase
MLIIGLTGGIASGKSAVAAELYKLGAVVLNADAAAHELFKLPDIKKSLVERWDEKILLPDGGVDRKAVADLVFSHKPGGREDREFLEKLLHPRIRAEFEYALTRLKMANTVAAVIDAPLLLEAGWDNACDVVLFVDSPHEDCKRRAQTLRNWTAEEFAARESVQMPIPMKRSRSSHVIVNDGSLADLEQRTREFWESVKNKVNTE